MIVAQNYPTAHPITPDIVSYTPKFHITRNTPITAMGSCFAVEISRHLQKAGYNYIKHLPIDASGPWGKVYNPASFRQFMEHAAGTWEPQISPWPGGRCPYRKWTPGTKEWTVADHPYTELRDATIRTLTEAKVFILTLGLIETWRHKTGDVAYQVPPKEVADDYSLCVDLVGYIEDDIELGMEAAWSVNANLKFVLTVSPVPLRATFRTCDVFTANLDSKNRLRIAARAIADDYDVVDYFPSYEMAMADPNPFRSDNRHVRPELISYIMRRWTDETIEGDL